MKKNLSALLLASLMTLCACGEAKNSESVKQESNSATSETPASPSAESISVESEQNESEEESPIEESTPVEDSSSGDEIPQFDIKLNKYIFVEGDVFKKEDVAYFRSYNAALEGYGTVSTFKVGSLPEEVPNGPCTVTLTAGRRKAEVEVYYYKDIETAAKNYVVDLDENTPMVLDLSVKRPSDITGGFYIRDYLKKDGTVSARYEFLYDEILGLLVRQGRGQIDYTEKQVENPQWNSMLFEIWEEGVPATLDETKKTVPHTLDKDGNLVTTTSNYEPLCETGGYALTDINNYYAYDIIVDADGHIAYLGKVSYGNTPLVDISSEQGYWSYYKDYTKNPAFIFAETYNAEDPEHKFDYEKVIPEGGFWAIGVNDYSTTADQTKNSKLDKLFTAMIGGDTTDPTNLAAFIRDGKLKLDIGKVEEETVVEEPVEGEGDGEGEGEEETLITDEELLQIEKNRLMEAALQRSIVKHIDRYIDVYNLTNNFEKFAYFYSIAYQYNKADLLAEAEEVLKNLIYETLPEIANEENLRSYYETETQKALDSWVAKFAS